MCFYGPIDVLLWANRLDGKPRSEGVSGISGSKRSVRTVGRRFEIIYLNSQNAAFPGEAFKSSGKIRQDKNNLKIVLAPIRR